MKIQLLSGIALTMMALAAVPAQAEEFKPYVSVFGGGSMLNSVDTLFAADQYSLETKTGYLLGVAAGLKLSENLRAEIELSHGTNMADSFQENADPIEPAAGSISTTYVLANIWLDIPTETAFTPYVGGGLGAGWASGDVTFNGDPYGYGSNASGAALAYQLGAGVKFSLSENTAIDVGYRFKGIGSTDFNDSDGDNDFYVGGKLTSHNLQVGLAFQF